MSGGAYDYYQDRLAEELFGWSLHCDYGEEGWQQAKKARAINPLEDRELSEMCWDMLCLLHSLDYWQSGDISKPRYLEDVEHFKEKWFGRTVEDKLDAYKEDLKKYAEELIKELG